MTPAPLQVGQAPSELELNSAGLTPFALAKALRIGSSSPVYVAGLLRREPRIAPWSTDDDPVPSGHRAVDQRALARSGDARDDAEHTERDVDVDVLQVVRVGPPDLQRARRRRAPTSLSAARSSRCRPVTVPLAPQLLDRALEADLPPAVPAPGPRSTTWSAMAIVSGLCSTTSTVLPLSRSCSSSSFIRCDVVRVQPDGRLVEDVGDVGERRAEVPDHLGPLASPPDSVPAGRSSER